MFILQTVILNRWKSKINGRKGEGAHCRVAVGEGLRASFGKNLDVLAIRFQVLFADGNLKVVAMIGRRYGRIPYGFYGRTEIFPGVSRREYKAEKERIGNCAMVVQPKTKSDLSKNRSLHYFVTPTGLKPVTFWSVVRCSIQLSYGAELRMQM